MKNLVFSREELKVLSRSSQWQLISSFFPRSGRRGVAHGEWSQRDTERHGHREILFVISGQGVREYCGRTYPVRPGTIILIDEMEPHDSGYPSDDSHRRYMVISFLNDQCKLTLVRVGDIRKPSGREAVWQQVYSLLSLGLTSDDAFFPHKDSVAPMSVVRKRCMSAVELLMANIVEKSYLPDAMEYHERLQRQVISSIVQYIDENHGKDCHVEHLARMAGYSKSHLSKLFRKHAGASLREFVNQTRAHSLEQMLKEGKRLKTISRSLGFSSLSAFYHWRQETEV